MLDHIDHYVKLVGIDHVGLGLDLTTGHEFDDFSLLGYKPEMYKDLWKDGVQQYLEGMENVGRSSTSKAWRTSEDSSNHGRLAGAWVLRSRYPQDHRRELRPCARPGLGLTSGLGLQQHRSKAVAAKTWVPPTATL